MKLILYFFLIPLTCMAIPVIEKNDRKILNPFFKVLLTRDTLGYVLLGEKPALLFGYIDSLSLRHPVSSLGGLIPYFSKENQNKKKAWEVWRKYSSALSSRFVIAEELSSDCPYSNIIFIINRDLFCKIVNENLDDFEQVLKRKITGEELLEQVKHQPLFSVLLKKNEALLGLILGFGKNNSSRYSRRKNMEEFGLFPKEEDKTDPIGLPVFRADWEDPETDQLREKYLKCRQKIKATFLEPNVLDEVLKILFTENLPGFEM